MNIFFFFPTKIPSRLPHASFSRALYLFTNLFICLFFFFFVLFFSVSRSFFRHLKKLSSRFHVGIWVFFTRLHDLLEHSVSNSYLLSYVLINNFLNIILIDPKSIQSIQSTSEFSRYNLNDILFRRENNNSQ